jgi:hypothetical protein
MTVQRVGLPFLFLAGVALLPAGARAQAAGTRTAGDSACTYSRCALRVDYRLLSTRLVRGASGESVSRLGWFGSGVEVLLAASDSAAYHAREYQGRQHTSDVLGIGAGALLLIAAVQGDEPGAGLPFLLGGAAVELIALPYWLGSRRSLDRAVWWYNRDLPRP